MGTWKSNPIMRRKDFPLMILAAGILLTVSIWNYAHGVRINENWQKTSHQADQVRLELTHYLNAHFSYLPRISSLVMESAPDIKRALSQYWQKIFQESPGIMASR